MGHSRPGSPPRNTDKMIAFVFFGLLSLASSLPYRVDLLNPWYTGYLLQTYLMKDPPLVFQEIPAVPEFPPLSPDDDSALVFGVPGAEEYTCTKRDCLSKYDCHKYISCSKDMEATLTSCPPSLLFNPERQLCDWASPSLWENCPARHVNQEGVPHEPALVIDLGIANDFTCEVEGVFPNQNSCAKYITCNKDLNAFGFSCPPNLLFDVAINKCNWAQQVDCDERARKKIRNIYWPHTKLVENKNY